MICCISPLSPWTSNIGYEHIGAGLVRNWSVQRRSANFAPLMRCRFMSTVNNGRRLKKGTLLIVPLWCVRVHGIFSWSQHTTTPTACRTNGQKRFKPIALIFRFFSTNKRRSRKKTKKTARSNNKEKVAFLQCGNTLQCCLLYQRNTKQTWPRGYEIVPLVNIQPIFPVSASRQSRTPRIPPPAKTTTSTHNTTQHRALSLLLVQ